MALAWGNTPMVELKKYGCKDVRVFAKIEGVSIGGSIKDRVGVWMVFNAIQSGVLDQTKTLIEATSGNTGIGLAIACCHYGIPCLLIVPDATSKEKIVTMKAYGAEIIKNGTIDDCIEFCEALSHSFERYVWLNQYDTELNVECHFNTTAPEIHNQLLAELDVLDYLDKEANDTKFIFLCAMGTTGTLMGCGLYFKQYGWDVIGVMPEDNSTIEGLKNLNVQRKPQIFSDKFVDEIIRVSNYEAQSNMKYLARSEGIMAGISSGAALAAIAGLVQKYASQNKKIIIVTILPDRGSNYIESGVWD